MLRHYPFRIYREGTSVSASTASGEPPLRTHAHACVHGRPRSAQHRFNRNQSTISRSWRGATRSARRRSLDPRGLSRARTRIRGNTRGKPKPEPGQSVGFDVAAGLLPSPSRIPLYTSRAPLFYSSLSLSLCFFLRIVRSSFTAVIPLPSAVRTCSLFRSLVLRTYASTQRRLHSAIYFILLAHTG